MALARSTFAGVALALALCLAPKAQAEVRTVEVVGQAAETGLGKSVTRRRALEDALIEAAIQGGADINGYTAISEGVLVSDQLVLRPASRILDYTVLSETTQNGFYRVKLRAVVGELPPPKTCERRASLDVLLYEPELEVDLSVPAWAGQLQADLAEAFEAAFSRHSGVTLQRAGADAPAPGRSAAVGNAMDYAALTQGVAAQKMQTGKLGFKASVKLEMVGERALRMTVRSRLIDGATRKTTQQDSFQHEVRLATKLPSRALNTLFAPDRREITRQLGQAIAAHVAQLVERHACRALAGPLVYAGNRLTLPFGAQDGLTKHHLAYSEGRDTPYILFDIVQLNANSVQLAPLDRRRSLKSLAGMQVRFMELGR